MIGLIDPTAVRNDVRRMLLSRGWTEDAENPRRLRKNGLLWVSIYGSRDCGIDGPRNQHGYAKWSLQFGPEIPARVIVAACEAAATGKTQPRPQRRRRLP